MTSSRTWPLWPPASPIEPDTGFFVRKRQVEFGANTYPVRIQGGHCYRDLMRVLENAGAHEQRSCPRELCGLLSYYFKWPCYKLDIAKIGAQGGAPSTNPT